MGLGQMTGMFSMGCWWGGTWMMRLYPAQWPYALGLGFGKARLGTAWSEYK